MQNWPIKHIGEYQILVSRLFGIILNVCALNVFTNVNGHIQYFSVYLKRVKKRISSSALWAELNLTYEKGRAQFYLRHCLFRSLIQVLTKSNTVGLRIPENVTKI